MDKMEKLIDDISKIIDNSIERERRQNKEVLEAIKFLGECLSLPFKDLKEYLSNRNRL